MCGFLEGEKKWQQNPMFTFHRSGCSFWYPGILTMTHFLVFFVGPLRLQRAVKLSVQTECGILSSYATLFEVGMPGLR